MINETSFEGPAGSGALLGIDATTLPQDPFFPQQETIGPAFLDTEACLCQLQHKPDASVLLPDPPLKERAEDDSVFWRCAGNQTEAAHSLAVGKWFKTQHGNGNIKTPEDIANLPVYDASNPPNLDRNFIWSNETNGFVETSNGLDIWDKHCTGVNRTSFSTSYYRTLNQLNSNQPPIDAAPCWRPGAIPLQIQNVTDWEQNGCAEGFYCPNNTINSLPQYCPPVTECQIARLAGKVCALNDTNISMGPFEPLICQAGHYCPLDRLGREMRLCPKGTYCQPGAAKPTPCSAVSICPVGSKYERFMLPVAVLVVVDLLLVIGIILLNRRSKIKNTTQEHQSKLKRAKTFKAIITGYTPLPDDTEMGPLTTATYNPDGTRHDVWSGFENAIQMTADDYAAQTPHPGNLETSLTPEIKAFVDSMRKATDATNIGLSFGYSQLAFQPKGSTRPILQNITGSIKRGSLTAVMGGSGAGKSTFVNVLMGKTIYTSGSVSINDIPGKLKRYKKLIGYVPQDDVILPELTVRENILHSARIRLPRSWKDAEIRNHVDSVIDCLELSHVRDSLVGSVGKPVISGGQRKRASIGMELAAAPMAIFLDEPTSGLDATAASSIMRTLKAIARLGISVIVIIHQPRMEIFDMLDDLILLANGQLVYEGPESEVKPFFERIGFRFPLHANFGDIVTDIITGNGRPYKKSGDISKDSLIGNWAALHQHQQAHDSSYSSSELKSKSSSSVSTITVQKPTPTSSRSTSPAPLPSPPSRPSLNLSNINLTSLPTHHLPPKLQRLSLLQPTNLPPAALAAHHSITAALSNRGAPLLSQTRLCLSRAILQQRRQVSTLLFELALASLAGFLLGLAESPREGVLFTAPYANASYSILSLASDFKSAPELALLVAIAIGLVSAAPGVKVFSEEMVLQRRESEAGHSRLAYFVAKTASVLPRMVLACLHFSTFLLLLAVPVVGWGVAFMANLLYFYCIYGLASAISMVVRREDAPLFATMISLITGILSGAAPPLSSVADWKLEWLWRASPGTWLAEVYFGQLVGGFGYLYDVDLASEVTGFSLDWLWRNMLILFAIGTVYRVLAFGGLFAGKRMRF